MAGNGIQLGFPFERTTASPIDFYAKVADITARDAIPSGIRYQGLKTFVVADMKTYVLKAGITNSDWVEDGGIGGGTFNFDTFTATGGQTVFTLTEDPGVKQNIFLKIDGVLQGLSTFSLSGKNITTSEGQAAGAVVEAQYGSALALTDVLKARAPIITEIYGSATGNFTVNAATKLIYFEICAPGAPGTGSARGSVNDAGVGGSISQASFGGTYVNPGSRGTIRTSLPPLGGSGGGSGGFGPEVSLTGRWFTGGADGEHGSDGQFGRGGRGGGGILGHLGGRGGAGMAAGQAGVAGTGGGGGGGTGEAGSQGFCGGGGGGGARAGGWIVGPTPGSTIAYVLPAGGTAGTAGTAGYAGGAGGPAYLIVYEFQ